MRIPKVTFLVPVILLLSFLVVVFAQKATSRSAPRQWLAVEVGLSTPMTVVAGTEGRTLKAFWRLPANDKMVVTVTVLSGDVSVVKTCKDWALLKASRVTSYSLSAGDEITVSQLPDLGSNFKNGKLTFRAIPVAAPQREQLAEPCCASCGGNTCCPGAGHCMSCPCGDLCC
jgi:hypothetical protein